MKNAERKVSIHAIRTLTKKRRDKKKITYHPWAFGLSAEPEFDIDGPSTNKRKQKANSGTIDLEVLPLAVEKLPSTCEPVNVTKNTISLRFVSDSDVIDIHDCIQMNPLLFYNFT